MIGLDVTGEIFGRDEFNLQTDIPESNLTFGEGGISCMAGLVGGNGKYAIGTQYGYLHVRDGYDNTWVNTHSINLTGSNSPVTSVVSRADGHILAGHSDNQATYRDFMDCRNYPPGITNGSSNFDNTDITATALLPNGHHAAATVVNGGTMYLRDKDDMWSYPPGDGWGQALTWAIRINDFAVDADGYIVIALEDGWTYTRHWTDISAKIGSGGTTDISVGWGSAVTEVEMLSNGNVVIGLANGQVHVRDSLDLTADLGNSVTISSTPITALEVTSNDNVVIASGSPGTTWVRKGSDLTSTPAGYTGPDGITWSRQVNSLAAVVSDVPIDCDDAIAMDYGLETDLSGDCYISLADFVKFAQAWGKCMDPGDQNCEHLWE